MGDLSDEVAALRGTKPATLKDLLTHPAFSKLMAAMGVSSLGDWIGFAAVASLVVSLGASTGSTAALSFAVSGVMIARMSPSIIFGPVAGPLVDRFDRKKLMMVSDVARGSMYFAMPFLPKLWMIYVLSFFIECFSLLWTPARDASLPNMVPRRQLANANSVGLMTTYATLPLGGVVFAILTAIATGLSKTDVPFFHFFVDRPQSVALWLDASTFAFSFFMISRLSLGATAKKKNRIDLGQVGRDIIDGVRFLREHSLAGSMTTGIVIGFAGVGAVISLGFVFVVQALHAGPAGYGILQATYGMGMAAGLATVGYLSKLAERDHVVYQAMIAAAVSLLLLALMPNLALAALMTLVLGYFVGTTWVTGYTLLQETVTDEFRGRTFGSLTVMSRLALFLALVVFPFLSGVIAKVLPRNPGFVVFGQNFDLSGTRLALAVAALMVLVGGLYMRRSLAKYRSTKSEPLGLIPKLKKPPAHGVFVVFEGVEGSGKGTQVARVAKWVESLGRDVMITREPGGTPLGEKLREMLLAHETGKLEPKTEALLFGAARAQLVSTVIRPALEQGNVVLCDRYIDSSLAYQGVARGLGEQDVLTLNVWATQGLFPDLVVLLHIEPEQGLERSLADGEHDRIESEGADFHAKVANAYLHIAEEHPERIVVIDSGRPADEVTEDVKKALRKVIPEAEGETEAGSEGGAPE